MQTFTARVSRTRDLTHDVREIELRLLDPPEIRFAAGQFVSFEIERPEFRVPITRAYSIASPPARTHAIDILLNRVPGGTGSGYLFGLQDGDRTSFKGPTGAFVLRDSRRDLLFVATGTGIAPIRSMLWSIPPPASDREIRLFWGLRSERDIYYQDDLAALQRRLARFSAITTLSRPAGRWRGPVGRVTPLVEREISDVSNLEVFLCGNAAMIHDVRAIVRSKGLCPIRTEQYYDDRTSPAGKGAQP